MNTGQTLMRALKLYGAGFKKVLFLSLSLSVIAFLPRLISFSLQTENLTQLPLTNPEKLWLVLIDLVCIMYFSAIIWRLNCINEHKQESLLDDMRVGLKKIPQIFLAVLLQGLISLVLTFTTIAIYQYLHAHDLLFATNPYVFILVSLPILVQFYLSIYLVFLLIFYFPIIVVESRNAFSAFAKSARLVWGNWWKTFGVQITPWLVYLVVMLIVKYLLHVNIHIYYLETHGEPLLAIFLHIALFAIFIPWTAATLLVQLRDLEAIAAKHKHFPDSES